MASGNTLILFTPLMNEPPATNYATFDVTATSLHTVLDFDQTTQEAAIFKGIMPRHYGGGGITVYVHWACEVNSGTVGWDIAIERVNDGSQSLTTDSFASAQTVTAATVPGTANVIAVTNVTISSGANMDSLAVGEGFRLRIRRDVANDTAAGDAQLWAIEIKET